VDGLNRSGSVAHHVADASKTLKEALLMPRDRRKTWQYFAQAVIQEADPEKLTYLMQQLYCALEENEAQPNPQLLRFGSVT
jgi:hypothetical protein